MAAPLSAGGRVVRLPGALAAGAWLAPPAGSVTGAAGSMPGAKVGNDMAGRGQYNRRHCRGPFNLDARAAFGQFDLSDAAVFHGLHERLHAGDEG